MLLGGAGPLSSRNPNVNTRKSTTRCVSPRLSTTSSRAPQRAATPRHTAVRPLTKENTMPERNAISGGGWTPRATGPSSGRVGGGLGVRVDPNSARRMSTATSASAATTTTTKKKTTTSNSNNAASTRKKETNKSIPGFVGGADDLFSRSSGSAYVEPSVVSAATTPRRKKKIASRASTLMVEEDVRGSSAMGLVGAWPRSALSNPTYHHQPFMPTPPVEPATVLLSSQSPLFALRQEETALLESVATLRAETESLAEYKTALESAVGDLLGVLERVGSHVQSAEAAMQKDMAHAEQLLRFVESEWTLKRSAMINRVAQMEEHIDEEVQGRMSTQTSIY